MKCKFNYLQGKFFICHYFSRKPYLIQVKNSFFKNLKNYVFLYVWNAANSNYKIVLDIFVNFTTFDNFLFFIISVENRGFIQVKNLT